MKVIFSRASKMKDLKRPTKSLFQNESDADVTKFSNKESEEEDYHTTTLSTRSVCIDTFFSQLLK